MLATPTILSIAPEPPQRTISVTSVNDGNVSDSGSGYYSGPEGLASSRANKHIPQTQKFPHLRGQLSIIAREYRFRKLSLTVSSSLGSSSGADSDADDSYRWEEDARVSSSLIREVAALLDEEKEDELKELLKSTFEMDDAATETPVLDLMHAHKDDISGVPFLFLTPNRRPISRPSSRASSHSFRLAPGPPRPDTPNATISAPSSPSLLGPIRRPHTPITSPLATGLNSHSYMTASPGTSPTLAHVQATSYLATSLPASPLSSPRLLNAKASEFRPTPRPLSAASSNPGAPTILSGRRAETPSPDLWAHGSGALRGASKLAIASPLIPDNSLLPPGTPPRAHTPTSPLRISSTRVDEHDEDEDPFDPFSQAKQKTEPLTFNSVQMPANSADFDGGLSNSSNSNSSLSEDSTLWGGYPHPGASYSENYDYEGALDPSGYGPATYYTDYSQTGVENNEGNMLGFDNEFDPDTAAALTDGMTPFDVLSSVFGATLAPSELEEALAVNGYEFERAMQWLVDRARPTITVNQQIQHGSGRGFAYGGGVQIVPRSQAGFIRGARGNFGGTVNARGGRFNNNTGRTQQGGNRVCRYFLAGECMRADCRFSHDLDRALCRFWLRGTCAKGEACEFLHHLPNEIDVQGLTSAMSYTDINDQNMQQANQAVHDEFPSLSHESIRNGNKRGYGNYNGNNAKYQDPGRTRFAAAVKKTPTPFAGAPVGGLAAQMAGRREAKAIVGDSVYSRPTVIAPRPSPRIKLRAPALLPTLPTGDSVSQLYMAYRSRALQLGAARNACLSRAADAWRRGDGAAAKRFSREGHDLNAKMATEAAEAAGKLVRERARVAELAVRNRDASWSDDPGDRASRGKSCGGGLGVCLGVASQSTAEDTSKLTPEERTEVALDLHGLHSNEASEVLEEFLLSLEREHFFGIAYVIVGEEKHTGTQDPGRGASRARLATGVKEWLHTWGYPWNERDGIIWVDPLTHMQ